MAEQLWFVSWESPEFLWEWSVQHWQPHRKQTNTWCQHWLRLDCRQIRFKSNSIPKLDFMWPEYCSDYKGAIWFQSGWANNQMLASLNDDLNEPELLSSDLFRSCFLKRTFPHNSINQHRWGTFLWKVISEKAVAVSIYERNVSEIVSGSPKKAIQYRSLSMNSCQQSRSQVEATWPQINRTARHVHWILWVSGSAPHRRTD